MTVKVRWRGTLGSLSASDRHELVARMTTVPADVRERVAEILGEVRAGGDDALVRLTERFDKVRLARLAVAPEDLARAHARAPAEFLAAFRRAARQLRAYHDEIARASSRRFQRSGVTAYERRVPLGTIGVYVPGGRAAYPSTVAMTVVPAQTAGVRRIVVASPPGPDGLPHPLVLAACHELGVTEVVAVGGAQAVFALALGTKSVARCDAVIGPGNAYVQAAKELIAGRVRIDAPAGPSEVALLVDTSADPAVAAREIAAQAEHDAGTLAVAVCLGAATEARVAEALEGEIARLPRRTIALEALAARGALLTARTLDEALAFLDELAPEHCILLHPEGERLAERLSGPACIVAGVGARVPLADYVAGPSHVLPTGGAARAYSGLGVEELTRRIHIVLLGQIDPELRRAAATLARHEGLDGHARAIEGGNA